MFRLATFHCDVTPPIGHPLCAGWYPAATAIRDPLSAHGLIFVDGGEPPIILCALDWAELSNHDHRRWRHALATAAGTEADRVAVHCIHAHDTPWPDRDAQDLLDDVGHPNLIMTGPWCERARERVAAAAAAAMGRLRPCSHVGCGEAKVHEVASNRRVMGDDGRVRAVRWTYTREPDVRAEPEGVIDPMLKSIGFWDEDCCLAVLHYYAVHPTAVDGTGEVTPEFVGLARDRRSREDGDVPHIYFTGCAGDITAGKYNDGTLASRELFAQRIHAAMKASEANAERQPLTRLRWRVEPVCLPPRDDMAEDDLRARMIAADASTGSRSRAALMLTYLQRRHAPIPITCLHLNDDVGILHLPGEAFVDYQLFAQSLRPEAFVAAASYGDLGTGYIPLERSYAEGGYEPRDAFVSGQSEAIMRAAIEAVL